MTKYAWCRRCNVGYGAVDATPAVVLHRLLEGDSRGLIIAVERDGEVAVVGERRRVAEGRE